MYKKIIKRFIDIFLCVISLPFLMLIFLLIAPVIHLADGGPVFYNGERLGYHGKKFKMFKFRSMKENAPLIMNEDGSTFNSTEDTRVTKIGAFIRKTSIDELPQIINILIGDMSFVGPRPGLPKDFDKLSDAEKRRRSVRPGITGYSQAYFRNSDTMEERMKNDLNYVENLTFLLDCKIFIKTITSVIKRENINRND